MSDNDEDSMPIAASLTKATKGKKPAKGLASFSPFLLNYFVWAFLFQPIAKKQRWFYEPVLDDKSPRSSAKHRTTAKEGTNIAEEERNESSEGDNTPIVASLLPKKKKKRKQNVQRWEYILLGINSYQSGI